MLLLAGSADRSKMARPDAFCRAFPESFVIFSSDRMHPFRKWQTGCSSPDAPSRNSIARPDASNSNDRKPHRATGRRPGYINSRAPLGPHSDCSGISSQMDQVCAIVCSSDLLVGQEVYIQELGHMGMGIGDRPHTRIYKLGGLNSLQNDRDARAFAYRKNGIPLDQESGCHAWFTVFEHLKKIWDEYSSERRPKIGVLGTDVVQYYYNEIGIKTHDVLDTGAPRTMDVNRDWTCAAHSEEKWHCCVAGKIAAYADWYSNSL